MVTDCTRCTKTGHEPQPGLNLTDFRSVRLYRLTESGPHSARLRRHKPEISKIQTGVFRNRHSTIDMDRPRDDLWKWPVEQGMESEMIKAPNRVGTPEQRREAAFQEQIKAEGDRVIAEEGRITGEMQRQQMEGVRLSTEQGRQAAEEARRATEETRQAAEQTRQHSEDARNAAEEAREWAEQARTDAEHIRLMADEQRQILEEMRATMRRAENR